MDVALGKKLVALRERIVAHFNVGHWEEIGLLTGETERILGYPRLLRSLNWGDEDYSGNVLAVIRQIVQDNPAALKVIEDYLDEHFPDETQYISAKPSKRKITFAPNVFTIPDVVVESDLVALMMPFDAKFDSVHNVVVQACKQANYRCLRVDDIWEDSVIIQDIFSLIFRSHIVVVDFTGKNANVMYETGIAHTLGKHVIPVSQSLDDVPFDMKHHRVLKYLPNLQGLIAMRESLSRKLSNVSA